MNTIDCHTKLSLLQNLYDIATWSNQGKYACLQGCDTCCTRSVTMTALEGDLILANLTGQELTSYQNQINGSTSKRPMMTTNRYVRQFLEHRTCVEEEGGVWSFELCPFLKAGSCTIYQVRPFMCRGFISLTSCRKKGFAEVPPQVVTLNTVMQQVIEHLAVGRSWGLMTDVINVLRDDSGQTNRGREKAEVLTCEEIPGFIIVDHEMAQIKKYLRNIHRVLQASLDHDNPPSHKALVGYFEQKLGL